MQISRHWRMQSQRYMLRGWKYSDGSYSISGQRKLVEEPIESTPEEVISEETGIEVQNWPQRADLKTQR